ncbi:amino acid ABC transporter permease [Streptomyces poriferorum]|uniref:Amino acid ABC transporter permease n=1 Tax=Streptomyces poriferorum TaxID=2798799 RepID=A0ABY9IWK5_9ACTN|nr:MULTISPECIES: amino acid ABC transporter permease [Streptomyces]MBW5253935.1 amino acid ABC transporter permease [Streptomyces poriferorum]MBW5258874.1 amino acid ABC transporter permease [Streptomyces poriferorum]MDP5311015.1 amino acid ABC transporter permease [Streptomyces sp. Alt4]WLQ47453.1 amino acid ABC transporter permease [Streptomyces sp. Alt1]WLQ59858.1 amino acid ABC transporter permease [Streptomyces sp. Alt2]
MSAQTKTPPPAPLADPLEDNDADRLRIVPVRRTGQWAAAAAVLVLLALALNSVIRNDAFQWGVVGDYFTTTAVLRGLGLTLWLTALVMALGFALGTLLAVLRLSANRVLQAVGWGYVWLFRSTPILVQLLFWFNIGALYPEILGVRTVNLLGPVTVAVVGLTLHEAAYAAEVVRGGILSVERGQLEAAQSLGLGPWRRLYRIVLPQAMRSIVPPAGNMLIGTLKGTSIVSIIAVQDLLYSVQLVYHRTYQVIPLLLVATLWYVVVTSLLSVGQHYVERYYARGTGDAR